MQVLEKASGKNAIRTGLPRSDDSVTFSPEVDGSVKSGACWPTAGTVDDGEMAVMEIERRSLKHTHSRIRSGASARSRRRVAGAVALLVAVALLGLAGCGGSAVVPSAASAPRPLAGPVERTTFAPSLGVHLDQMLRHASGLYVQDLKVGTGAVALKGKSMVVRYAGYLSNGTEFDHGEITVQIGADNTITAWKEGLLGMRVGGQRRLVVPPSLGYGTAAAGEIPPNSVLVFDIEMTSAL